MSFSLSFSGHHNDAALAQEIDDFVVAKGREIAAGLIELDPNLSWSGIFGGPSQSVNFKAEIDLARADAAPDDPSENESAESPPDE